MKSLSISIVVYDTDTQDLKDTLESLLASVEYAKAQKVLDEYDVLVVDNGKSEARLKRLVEQVFQQPSFARVFASSRNIGFGAGHNIAIKDSEKDFHLILNPDVIMPRHAIPQIVSHLLSHPEIVIAGPSGVDQLGNNCYLAKRKPSPLILGLRALPFISFTWANALRMHYEFRGYENQNEPVQVPLISGCFMLARTNLLKQLGGFDESFFLYFEDFDLCHKANRLGPVVYVPQVVIEHRGGNASRKGLKHIIRFVASAYKYFQRWGWSQSTPK